jgi:hypothetical protein
MIRIAPGGGKNGKAKYELRSQRVSLSVGGGLEQVKLLLKNLHVSQKLLHVEQLELQPTGSNRKVVTLDLELVVFGLTRKSQPL